jgi:hypothetical protein
VTYAGLRSMMNLLLRIITNVVLGLLLSLRFITVRRRLVLLRILIQRKMAGLLHTDTIGGKNRQLSKIMKKDGTHSKGSNVQ